ncbi:creatininase [Burkholderia contaminans]|uniref:creatininase family protein n=1 Tax=Burkholderia contaminans TaxID=488447 RepID=UPI001453A9B5|nr:creatininase family protein [Burkholderia contaminans]VWC92541.1 creatininase [Burkholderia contaminans]
MRLYLRHAFAAAIALMTAGIALAQQPPTSVLLEDLTWTELRDQIQAGKTTVIVPIGGVEQSGPYVALGKHNARVKVLSQRIAEGLGNAIVAPVVAYVPEGGYAPPTSHMRFPGTITVPDDVFEKTLESAANSFKIHGFRNVVFLGDHGGYQNDIRRAVAQLNKSWAGSSTRAFVPGDYYATSSDGYSQILRQHGVADNEIGTHAGLADTSLLLAVAPQMVRVDKLRNGPKVGAADGVYGGDPRRSSVELGQLGTDAIVSRTIAEIRKETAGH